MNLMGWSPNELLNDDAADSFLRSQCRIPGPVIPSLVSRGIIISVLKARMVS
jgi:hypothetical protein